MRWCNNLRMFGLGLTLALAGCGGSGGGEPVTDPPGPVVTGVTCPDGSISPTAAGCSTGGDPTSNFIALGATISGSVEEDGAIVYRVPSGSEVILMTSSGDADLFLLSTEAYSNDNVLCGSRRDFIEDNCTATVAGGGDVYAYVYGNVASQFTISTTDDCSTEAINNWVYRSMRDYYLYSDSVPAVNPATYANTSDLVRDLRLESLDPYSGIGDAATTQAFFDEGTEFGFGFNWAFDDQGNPRVLFTYDDSPFGRANIKRGDIIVGLNDENWNMTDERFFELVGTRENPLTNTWRFIDGATGEAKSANIAWAEYSINTVLESTYYTSQSSSFAGKIGYINFKTFIRKSEAELDAVIENFANLGDVSELVLDLRYNGGGYIYIAQKLAAQIAGPDLAGELFVRYEHNRKYSALDFTEEFSAETPTLDLDRVIVLTSGRTASSSELVINSLKPYIDVVVIGGTTEGKPYISTRHNYCGKSLSAMDAEGVNNNGVSVLGGIAPMCYAQDDFTRDFGGTDRDIEGMLLAGLDYIVSGTCDTAPTTLAALPKQSTVQSGQVRVGTDPSVGESAGLSK